MIRRPGVTLIEVLVSIFIMGIGMLALLTLFPLGALTMAQAIKDDRSGASARNAYAIVAARDLRKDSSLSTPADLFNDPTPSGAGTWPTFPAGYEGPSYPIYVDPFGMQAGASPTVGVSTAPASPGILRRNLSVITSPQQALRWFSLLDDMEFYSDDLIPGTKLGEPKVIGGAIQRSNRYTWALMLRRPRVSNTSLIEMAVVVYYSRPLELASGEPTYGPVTFDVNSNEVTVNWAAPQERPPVRKGSWILDATVVDGGAARPHGYFYRVVGVAETGPNTLVLELEEKPRIGTTNGVLVVMENVHQVFDEGLGWKP